MSRNRYSGEQPAAVPQRRRDRDAGPGRQGDQAGRVAADDHYACVGGEGQPVPAAPAQRAGDRPVGHPAGAVDVGEPVHHVPAERRRAARCGRHQSGSIRAAAGARAGRPRTCSGRRNDRSDQRAGHGCLPRREAGPVSAVGRPQAPAGPSACSSRTLNRLVIQRRCGCPRGDLNPRGGEYPRFGDIHPVIVTGLLWMDSAFAASCGVAAIPSIAVRVLFARVAAGRFAAAPLAPAWREPGSPCRPKLSDRGPGSRRPRGWHLECRFPVLSGPVASRWS